MQIRCAHCNALGNVPPAALQKKVRCPRCGNVFKVTDDMAQRGADRRRSRRYEVDTMNMDFGIVAGRAQVLDLSATGVGFEPPDTDADFDRGDVVCFTLLDNNKTLLKDVHVRITRKASGAFGGEFQELSDLQYAEIKAYLARQRFRRASDQGGNDVELELGDDVIGLKTKNTP